jgi:hypothetical protein
LANSGAAFFFLNKILGKYIVRDDNISNATQKMRKNLKVLLKDHVFKIQQFEPDKNKLWNKICLHFELLEALDSLKQGFILKSSIPLIRTIFLNPYFSLEVIGVKSQSRLTRFIFN